MRKIDDKFCGNCNDPAKPPCDDCVRAYHAKWKREDGRPTELQQATDRMIAAARDVLKAAGIAVELERRHGGNQ